MSFVRISDFILINLKHVSSITLNERVITYVMASEREGIGGNSIWLNGGASVKHKIQYINTNEAKIAFENIQKKYNNND